MSDAQLYREMDAVLKAYDDRKVGFRGLLDRLEDCADHIAEDTDWQGVFRQVWGKMEDDYAFAASMGWKQIPQDRMPAVLAALSEIRGMVASKVAETTPSNAKSD